jgi:hypothetical protein
LKPEAFRRKLRRDLRAVGRIDGIATTTLENYSDYSPLTFMESFLSERHRKTRGAGGKHSTGIELPKADRGYISSRFKEARMIVRKTISPSRCLTMMISVVLCFLSVVAKTPAQTSSNPQTASGLKTISGQEQVKVLGHLPLNGMHVNQMFSQLRGDKVYLYLHRPTKDAFAVVDVTKPDKPTLLTRDVLKESSGEQIQTAPGSALAIAVTPENGVGETAAAPVSLPTETVQFVDMSDPKNVKSVKKFTGVTSVYSDDGRKLVFLVNGEGLWIVGHHMTHPLPLCNSEASLTPIPDCQ